MKKEVNFQNNEGIYEFKYNEEVLFSINGEDMQFDVKNFYNAFFLKDEFENIEFLNQCEDDKKAARVFECTKDLFSKIADKLKNSNIDNAELLK